MKNFKTFLYENKNKKITAYNKGDRVIVNYNTPESPKYYIGTVSKAKNGMVNVKFDDGDKGKYDLKKKDSGLMGIAKPNKKRKSEIPADKIDSWLLLKQKFYNDKIEFYNEKGQLDREDGPAVELFNGDTFWYKNGKKHRLDGPAREWANGSKQWFKNGKLHRDGKLEAIEWNDGSKEWYKEGIRHREDGPAIEWADGRNSWFLNGKKVKKKDVNPNYSRN